MKIGKKITKFAGEEALSLLAEIIVIYTAVHVNNLTGPFTAITAFLGGTWLAYNVSSYERLWNTVSMLKNPAKAFILYASTSSIYFALQSYQLNQLLMAILASSLIGAGLAILLQKYWNIGG